MIDILKKNLRSYASEIFALATLAVIFRLPLRFLGGDSLMRAPAALITLISIIYILINLNKLKSFVSNNKFHATLIFLSLISPVSIFLINGSFFQAGPLKTFIATILTYSLFSLAISVSLSKEQIIRFLDFICITCLFIGGTFWLFESITEATGYFSREFYNNLIMSHRSSQIVARYGFQGDAANSLALLISSAVWCLSRCFEVTNQNLKKVFITGIIIAILSTLMGESILSLMILAITFFTTLLAYPKFKYLRLRTFIIPALVFIIPNKTLPLLLAINAAVLLLYFINRKFAFDKELTFPSIIIILALNYFSYSSRILTRIMGYLNQDSHLLKFFIPNLHGCTTDTFLKNAFNKGCHFGEFHLLKLWNESNAIILLMTLAFIMIPLVRIIKIKEYIQKLNFSYIILPASIILLSAHYRPIATWGMNLLFSLSLALLIKREEHV